MHRQSLSGVELLNGYLNERGLGREELQLQALEIWLKPGMSNQTRA